MVPPLSAFHSQNLFEELLAAEIAASGLLVSGELALDHHLRRDAGVVGSRLP